MGQIATEQEVRAAQAFLKYLHDHFNKGISDICERWAETHFGME